MMLRKRVFRTLNSFFIFFIFFSPHQPLQKSKLSRGKQSRRKPTTKKPFNLDEGKNKKTESLTALKSGEPDEFCLWILEVCSFHF